MTAVAIVIGVCFLAWRLELVASRVFDRQFALNERRVAIDERRFAPKPSESELPKDIERLCLQQSEEWAQNDMRKLAREFYGETEDWRTVARQLQNVLTQQSPDDRVILS